MTTSTPCWRLRTGVVEHVVGLAHAGSRADVDAKLGRLLLAFELDFCHGSAHLDRMRDRLRNRNGKSEAEGGADAEAALDGDLAAQRLDEAAHQARGPCRCRSLRRH